jgi:hypothetical protein
VVRINSDNVVIDDNGKDDFKRWSIKFGSLSAGEQYKLLLKSNQVWASTWMFSKNVYNIVNGFDERYRCFEDLPFLHSITKNGIKIFYIDIIGSFYRIHNNSVQRSINILSCFEESRLSYFINELKGEIPLSEYRRLKKNLFLKKTLCRIFKNKKNFFSKMIVVIASKLKII